MSYVIVGVTVMFELHSVVRIENRVGGVVIIVTVGAATVAPPHVREGGEVSLIVSCPHARSVSLWLYLRSCGDKGGGE